MSKPSLRDSRSLTSLVTWLRELTQFHQVLLAAAVFTGLSLTVPGLYLGEPLVVLMGAAWLLGGPFGIKLASDHDSHNDVDLEHPSVDDEGR